MKKIFWLVSAAMLGALCLTGCGGNTSSSGSSDRTNPTLSSISLSGPASTVAVPSTLQLSAMGTYSDSSQEILTSKATWQSSDTTIATMNASGLLTAVKAGSVTITATMGMVSGTMSITVTVAPLTSIAVNGASSLAAGTSVQLAAQGTYADNSTQDLTSQVTWQSSDNTIATVSSSGLLTAVQAGTVTITASMGTVSGTMSITVTQAAQVVLTSISVSGASSSLAAGTGEQLVAIGTYSDSSTQNLTSQVAWQSSDSTTATVSASGLLATVKVGNVTISATLGGVSGSMPVTVTAATLSSITVTPSSFSIASGQTKQLTAQGVYSDGSTQNITAQVTWTSGAQGVATVSAAGLVTGVSQGPATITATSRSSTGSASATVTAAVLNSITISPSTASIAIGQTQPFDASGVFSDGSSTDMTDSVAWSSSATNFATINFTGLATGVATGSTSIGATSGTVTGNASLAVTAAVLTAIDISPDGQTIPIGGQLQLTVTGMYSDNSTQPITNATWSSSNSALASTDPNTGIVTGVANSNNNPVTITATSGAFTDTTTVYVTAAVMESLQLTPATSSVASGTTQQYVVSAIYSDGSNQPLTAGLQWTSSSSATAGVSATGLATGIAPGQTTITAAYGSITGTATLTVTPAVVASIVVTPALPQVGIGGIIQFTATGVFTDSSTQDLTSQAAWSSSSASVALVNSSGLATALSLGTTTISASYQGVSSSAVLTVANATLVSINIIPANPIVPPNTRLQMTAIGVFSDGSQAPLSNVTWSISGNRGWWFWGHNATISRTGLVWARRASTNPIVIYAKLDGITGQTTMTITSMTLASLQITPANPTIAAGTNQQFHLIGTYSDGVTTVDLTNSAWWQTSNWRCAFIRGSGLAYGLSSGSVTITGNYRGLTAATTTLTVSNATIVSIAITPSAPTILLGAMEPFTATGTFSDGSTQDITLISKWTSSVPTVAVVNHIGVASSASNGETNISAQFDGVTGTTLLTVN
ncbi:MAG: Ig-like domain-containing protein [Terracidiphilus sp.]